MKTVCLKLQLQSDGAWYRKQSVVTIFLLNQKNILLLPFLTGEDFHRDRAPNQRHVKHPNFTTGSGI